ncbi:unnamed protein product, partial [marine sediment metagenome]
MVDLQVFYMDLKMKTHIVILNGILRNHYGQKNTF